MCGDALEPIARPIDLLAFHEDGVGRVPGRPVVLRQHGARRQARQERSHGEDHPDRCLVGDDRADQHGHHDGTEHVETHPQDPPVESVGPNGVSSSSAGVAGWGSGVAARLSAGGESAGVG